MSEEMCDAKIRPMTDGTEIECGFGASDHPEHQGVLKDYAWPGSTTIITWLDDDRRTYRGEWRPCDNADAPGCILPAGHRGRCAR